MLKRRTAAVMAASFTAATVLGFGLLESGTASASAPAARTSAPVAAVATHHGSKRLITRSGVTMLKLDAGTAKALADNGVKVTLASEARPGKSGITFPIRGGVLNPANLHGYITHEGGLTFTAGGKSLTVRDFTVRTTTGKLTGYADEAGARITILNLSLKHAKVGATKNKLAVSNVKATLNGQAAKALDAYFGTKLFTPGLTIGTVRVGANITTYFT